MSSVSKGTPDAGSAGAPRPIPPPPLLAEHLQHLSDYGLLYCHTHKHPVPLNGLDRHLLGQHGLGITVRRPLIEYCRTLHATAAAEPALVALPPDGSLANLVLPLYRNGFSCTLYRFLTISRECIRRHLNQTHSIYRSACAQHYSQVQLQSWYPGPRARYWTVRATDVELRVDEDAEAQPAGEAAALQRLEQEELARLALQDTDNAATWDAEVEFSDTTPWLLHTKWPEYFAGRPLDILAATARQPAKFPDEDLVLGFWASSQMESPLEDEIKIRAIVDLLDPMFARCLRTLEASSYQVRCWIKSHDIHRFYPYPFKPLQSNASWKAYTGLWRRFLSYVFRVWATPRDLRSEIYWLKLTRPQEATMARIWAALDDCLRAAQSGLQRPATTSDTRNPNLALDPETSQQLTEWLFALSVQFVAQVQRPSSTELSPLLDFTAVLGIHSYSLIYRTAYVFTPLLAGLVWIARLLILEYALPLEAYTTAEVDWPSRDAYEDEVDRLHTFRRRFLCRGGFHPTGALVDMLAFGRSIARKEGRRTNISWSCRKDTLTLYDCDIHLPTFQQMVHSAVRRCRDLQQEALLGWTPSMPDLYSIRDSLVQNQPGWSFLRDPSNGLQNSFRHLQRRAFSAKKLAAGNRWSLPQCQAYLSSIEGLKKQLLVCLHFTGGLPGRGTEITTIRWCNTRQSLRNIFVHNGRLVIVIEYNKTRASTNHSFYVVRVLPLVVSEMLFIYLAYIRPFCDALAHQLKLEQRALSNHYLFTSPDRIYSSDTLSKAIHRESTEAGASLLTIATYRQAALAIAKEHIEVISKPLNLAHPLNHGNTYISIAWQAGHCVPTLLNAYALNHNYPTRLQPELIRQYEQMSQCWHDWLKLDELHKELRATTRDARKALVTKAEAEAEEDDAKEQVGMGKPKGKREWGGVAAAMETGSRKRQCTLGVGAEEKVLIPYR